MTGWLLNQWKLKKRRRVELLPDTAKEKPMKGKIIAVRRWKNAGAEKGAELLVKRETKSFMERRQAPRLLSTVKNVWLWRKRYFSQD